MKIFIEKRSQNCKSGNNELPITPNMVIHLLNDKKEIIKSSLWSRQNIENQNKQLDAIFEDFIKYIEQSTLNT